MDNSILEQIIDTQKIEEVNNLNAVNIIDSLFSYLSDREKDILIKRYGLHSDKKETLESIGNVHNLTRERIRQIEISALDKIKKLEKERSFATILKNAISQILEDHGGFAEQEYLFDILINYSLRSSSGTSKNRLIHGNYLNFLIKNLLFDDFDFISNSPHFKNLYKLKYQNLKHLEELAIELYEELKIVKQIYKTEEILSFFKKLNSFQKHQEKLKTKNIVDVSSVLIFDFFEENYDIIKNNKILYSLLRASKKINQNKFGYWGIHNWKTIKPRTINDKVYLVLKYHNKPMHFNEIAEAINKISFDSKKANPATVHNELILDDNYVLIGRGIYSLKEWGYKKGAVADVIEDILKEAKQGLSRDEIVKKVLEKRKVKDTTIILALMNKKKFKRVNDKYFLVKY